jgi:hypothetical protein
MPCHQSTYFLIIFEHIYTGKNGGFTGVLTNNWRGQEIKAYFFEVFFVSPVAEDGRRKREGGRRWAGSFDANCAN